MLYARGSHNVGHTFFVKDGQLHFDYNALGTHYRATGDIALTAGQHTIEARFNREGSIGKLTLARGRTRGRSGGQSGRSCGCSGSTGVDIGRDGLSPVVDDYTAPFEFTGELKRIVFRTGRRRDATDVAAAERTEMGTQ